MAKVYNKLQIDVNARPTGVITAVQKDAESRYLDVVLLDGSTPIDLTGHEVRIYGKKGDGTAFYNNGEITNPEGGRCQFLLTDQALAVAQDLQTQIIMFRNNEEVLSTQIFTIHVVKSLLSNSAIESSNEYGALTVLYQNLYEAYDLMTTMVQQIGVPQEIAQGLSLETMWEAWEFMCDLLNKALASSSVDGVMRKLGDSGDTETANTLMGKGNAILKRIGGVTDGDVVYRPIIQEQLVFVDRLATIGSRANNAVNFTDGAIAIGKKYLYFRRKVSGEEQLFSVNLQNGRILESGINLALGNRTNIKKSIDDKFIYFIRKDGGALCKIDTETNKYSVVSSNNFYTGNDTIIVENEKIFIFSGAAKKIFSYTTDGVKVGETTVLSSAAGSLSGTFEVNENYILFVDQTTTSSVLYLIDSRTMGIVLKFPGSHSIGTVLKYDEGFLCIGHFVGTTEFVEINKTEPSKSVMKNMRELTKSVLVGYYDTFSDGTKLFSGSAMHESAVMNMMVSPSGEISKIIDGDKESGFVEVSTSIDQSTDIIYKVVYGEAYDVRIWKFIRKNVVIGYERVN